MAEKVTLIPFCTLTKKKKKCRKGCMKASPIG